MTNQNHNCVWCGVENATAKDYFGEPACENCSKCNIEENEEIENFEEEVECVHCNDQGCSTCTNFPHRDYER